MKINITPEQFASIIIIYLLDKINNREDIIPDNESFEDLIDNIKKMKSHLTRFYLNSDINNRIYYKRLRRMMDKEGSMDNFTISIKKPNKTNESLDENSLELNENEINKHELKDLVKKVIKAVKKRKFYKATYLSDEDLDKIIMKIIEKGEY